VDVLTGLRPATGGAISLHGQVMTNAAPRRLRDQGLASIPEDRHARGLVLDYSVADNLILGSQNDPAVTGGRLLSPRRILERARRLIRQFDIRGAVPSTPARSLSGGNQQKVVLAREIDSRPRFLIAAQP